MEKAYKSGKAKAIGISNFSRAETERLLKETSVVPAANQLEVHPYLQQSEAVSWFQSKGIHVQQYSPYVAPLLYPPTTISDLILFVQTNTNFFSTVSAIRTKSTTKAKTWASL